jgi:hypothetical protein
MRLITGEASLKQDGKYVPLDGLHCVSFEGQGIQPQGHSCGAVRGIIPGGKQRDGGNNFDEG